jgi:hypothetical protein
MKELQIENTSTETEVVEPEQNSKSARSTRKKIFRVRSQSPASGSTEIPILCVLSRAPDLQMRAKAVLQEVTGPKWFPNLSEEDRKARYPRSKRKIVESVAKWSKKDLVLSNQIYSPQEVTNPGMWKLTAKGLARAKVDASGWTARYAVHEDAIVIERSAEKEEAA